MKSLFKVAVLSLCLLTAVSFAYAGNGKGAQDGSVPNDTAAQRGPNYVDQNKDGICDNIGSRIGRRGKGYGAGSQAKCRGFRRGLKDGSGPINRSGVSKPNYVDENGDGICDNLQTKSPSK
ncbi:MAG: hypothetical protein L6247_05285 [Desulfobacteraceae bacterium]|nr:hypothetical protein [Pseudomonadota bacterium]MCG2754966.1 hypothetical protein [Desulfobacteraceae bacterium]